jgi:hypothetical protein
VSFFDSELVKSEMLEIVNIQENIYKNIFKFPTMTIEEKKDHIFLLEKLLNKQKILYARLSLSDDPEAILWKNEIQKQALLMGMSENISINTIFNGMESMIKKIKDALEK